MTQFDINIFRFRHRIPLRERIAAKDTRGRGAISSQRRRPQQDGYRRLLGRAVRVQ